MRYELRHDKRQLFEFVALFSYALLSSWATLLLELGFTEYAVLFWLPPLVYMLIKLGSCTLKTLIVSTVLAAIFIFTFDVLAHATGAWVIYGSSGYKIFNTTLVDNFIWGLLYAAYIIAGYQYFFDRYRVCVIKPALSNFLRNLTFFVVLAAFGIGSLFLILSPEYIPVYAFIVLVMTIVSGLILYTNPHIAHKVLIWSGIVFVLSIPHEYVALELNHWSFEAKYYLMEIDIFNYSIPLEEFFWWFFAVTFIVSIYEVFVDNGK